MQDKVTTLTSKELLTERLGVTAVHYYEQVKADSMYIGNRLAELLIRRVGGMPGRHGDPFDGETALGRWEFCLQRNSKNHAGDRADQERAPGHCVQILERPKENRISAEEFLVRHGEPATALLDALAELRLETPQPQQRMAI